LARPSDATIKRLFAVSHNLCGHPDCGQPLVEGGTVVGEVCHITGERPGAARYDPDQTDAERHAFENLICMCRKHHKIIDTEKEKYTVERLFEMKRMHEASDSWRYVISDELVQRLGEMLATEAEDRPLVNATAYPDWAIRELFFHIRPDLIDEPDERRWEQVGRQVMDHFSTGRLSVWGRLIDASRRRGSLKRVDEPGFWDHARFSYWFLKDDGVDNSHVYHQGSTQFPNYADLQVSHAEALTLWPISGAPQNDRTEIMLLDAARRVYSETRNDPVALHAEAFGNSPESILTWYCIWLAQHIQIYGARRPSTKMEPLSLDNPLKDFDISNGTLTMRERYGSTVYENLRGKLDELPAIIRELKSYGKG
jgi:hypothetical protein